LDPNASSKTVHPEPRLGTNALDANSAQIERHRCALTLDVEARLSQLGVHRDSPLLLACSGGRDSVFLTEILHAAGFSALTLLHLDHGLRPESAADAEWVQRFGVKHKMPVVVERIDVADLAKQNGLGLEESGRNARYDFFTRTARRLGCSRVLLAHHADDQVETFLFRLLRGTGANGLRGMAVRSERRYGDFTLEVLRPILHIWRAEIDRFVSHYEMDFSEDSSNAHPRWSRNRIRHELMPHLEQVMQRPVRSQIAHAVELLRAEAAFVEAAELALGPMPMQLDVAAMRALPLALQRRRIHRWLSMHGIPEISFDLVESVLGLLTNRQPAKRNLPGGSFVRRRSGVIFVERLGE